MTYYEIIDSPIGPIGLAVDEKGDVLAVSFHATAENGFAKSLPGEPRRDPGRTAHVAQQLKEYFQGRRRRFELGLAPEGTDFQKAVWSALGSIPFGETRSYGQIARRIGRPAASRAVGRANGANPIPIIVPCHRVVGADGALTGFGGGIETKSRLLQHERRVSASGVGG